MNYVMLEYILTRQDPLDQKVISDAQGLEFLVLDELHTYRGVRARMWPCWCGG